MLKEMNVIIIIIIICKNINKSADFNEGTIGLFWAVARFFVVTFH